MKINGMVSNMCLSKFMVEISGYDSSRTNQGTLRRNLARWSNHYLGTVHPRDAIDSLCMDRWGIVANCGQKLREIVESLTCTSL